MGGAHEERHESGLTVELELAGGASGEPIDPDDPVGTPPDGRPTEPADGTRTSRSTRSSRARLVLSVRWMMVAVSLSHGTRPAIRWISRLSVLVQK